MSTRSASTLVCKAETTDPKLGVVFGYATVESVDGELYFDSDNDNIPTNAIAKAIVETPTSITSGTNHEGNEVGKVVFAMPTNLGEDSDLVSKSNTNGMYVGIKFDEDTLAKFESGELTGFSIYGAGWFEEIE